MDYHHQSLLLAEPLLGLDVWSLAAVDEPDEPDCEAAVAAEIELPPSPMPATSATTIATRRTRELTVISPSSH